MTNDQKLDEISKSLESQKQVSSENVKLLREVLNTIKFNQIKTNCLFEALTEIVGISADKWGMVKDMAEMQTNKILLEKSHQAN